LAKKGKSRWFLVVNDIIMWYEKEQVRKKREKEMK
jgi:hypothetical protein